MLFLSFNIYFLFYLMYAGLSGWCAIALACAHTRQDFYDELITRQHLKASVLSYRIANNYFSFNLVLVLVL